MSKQSSSYIEVLGDGHVDENLSLSCMLPNATVNAVDDGAKATLK